jgi:hypothetical protein
VRCPVGVVEADEAVEDFVVELGFGHQTIIARLR